MSDDLLPARSQPQHTYGVRVQERPREDCQLLVLPWASNKIPDMIYAKNPCLNKDATGKRFLSDNGEINGMLAGSHESARIQVTAPATGSLELLHFPC